ncbi:dUTP diphosphatase [Fluviicola taffensis]|uniref:Deoxyuridine 5'-triphosphate nucleotidohydrolase n=1 Tax=Fluviicola taffensis (strain DSM 16823 / NCIMB 13979 / RW262) TaxID=755732 RepID=F2IG06_FLUTR|nr:dUTP diphosphatase [Fluviicola taffensis]AEA43627.1 Deoxyuridine 5'-triphosphate nucleotidohydrolase [Fluviicola taffensis DSM 16823]
MEIKVINQSNNELPHYATVDSAGLDIRAFLSESVTLKPLERRLIPTGLYLEIPSGFEVQIRPRSGFAFKQGVTVLNSPGTIDADYRGEIGVLLINLSQEDVLIETGDRVAQMVVAPFIQATLNQTNELSETSRGEGGFGSTGKN